MINQFNSFQKKIVKNAVYYGKEMAVLYRSLLYPIWRPKLSNPIFIVGCSRAGTTAAYLALSQSADLRSLFRESHETWERLHPASENGWNSHQLTAKEATDADKYAVTRFFYTQLGRKRFVDKANQNCFRIPYLKTLFRDASFLFVKRNGPDNVNSLIHGWARPGEYGKWALDLPEKVAVDGGNYTTWCFFLFEGWRNYLRDSIENVCAQQWIAANTAVLRAKSLVPAPKWVEVSYEDILLRPVETFWDVFSKLSIPFTPVIEKYCSSLVQNPTNAFSKPRLNKWKEENPEQISNILPLLDDTMGKLGYKGY
ncbi:MAG: sulfotransferase [Desulfobacterales bacterium]|jgi:hypothetical protein|nr:sulfotransferase [Desulfobacterales bacterium]